MKNNYLDLTNVIVSLVAVLVLFTAGTVYQRESSVTGAATISEEVYAIFEKSCIRCHARGGNLMAMTHVNFTNWDKYKTQKQASLAADICKMITKGTMPPKSARESNPGSVPTQEQIKTICDWSNTLKVKK